MAATSPTGPLAAESAREELARIAGPDALVVASISGGKDSAAMSLWLTEQGIEHRRVFADTGWEASQTYEYLRGPLAAKFGPIDEVRGEKGGFADLVRHKGMFPSRVARFCTEMLKLRPLYAYVARCAIATGRPVVNAVGVRAAESAARAKMMRWDGVDTRAGTHADIWRPLLTWTEQDVIDIHRRHGLTPNPLYLAGASRVGCWPCIHARKAEIALVARLSPERIDEIRVLEAEVSAAAAEKGAENPTRALFQARISEDGERFPVWPIDKVVEWSRTSRGGRQFELFDSRDPDEGCVRWGLCEHPTEAA